MSIKYFPEIYPDELVYSVLARYYEHIGYPTYAFCAEDIFVNKRVKPDIEFFSIMKIEVLGLLCRDIPITKLVEKHTMFPYYGRFLPFERRNKAFKALCDMAGDYNNLLPMPKHKNGEKRYLRYCPLCAEEDKTLYGETYWHRSHQIQEMKICPLHGCRLQESSIIISTKASPNLITAQQEVKELGDVIYGSEIEQKLAMYVWKVFQADIDIENSVAVGEFLYSKMEGTKYLSVNGRQRHIQRLYNDFMTYYRELPVQDLAEQWQIYKVLTGYRTNTFEICQIAMFMGISIDELTKMKLPARSQEELFSELVKKMYSEGIGYNQIARKLGVSSKTIRDTKNKKYKKRETIKHYRTPCGARRKDWGHIDKEALPLIKNAIRQLQEKKGERPCKVTGYAVCKITDISVKSLKHMPLCMAEILKYEESQEQYWAREIVWAVHKVQKEGKAPNWRQIRMLTNMRKDNVLVCLPYLKVIADPSLYELVQALL